MRIALTLAFLAGVSVACDSRSHAFPEPPEDLIGSAVAVREGETIYQRDCSICHGSGGHGDGPQAKSLDPAPSDLQNLSGRRADPGYWFFRIKEGGKAEPLARRRSAMPGWGDHMSDEEIWRVVAYLEALREGRT